MWGIEGSQRSRSRRVSCRYRSYRNMGMGSHQRMRRTGSGPWHTVDMTLRNPCFPTRENNCRWDPLGMKWEVSWLVATASVVVGLTDDLKCCFERVMYFPLVLNSHFSSGQSLDSISSNRYGLLTADPNADLSNPGDGMPFCTLRMCKGIAF